MAGKRRERERMPSDGGPLSWLVGFGNLGYDDGQPRPPIVKVGESRFLGLDARRKDYAFDPDRPSEVIEGGGPWGGDVVTQERGGVTKEWLRLRRGTEEILIPHLARGSAPLTWEMLQRFVRASPPRPVLRVPGGGPLWRVKGGDDAEEQVVPLVAEPDGPVREEVLTRLRAVRYDVRMLLEAVWTVTRDDEEEDESARLRVRDPGLYGLFRATIRETGNAIANLCLGQLGNDPPIGGDPRFLPPPDPLLAAIHRDTYKSIDENRAPVWMEVTDAFGVRFVSDALPGIAWAECLNLLLDRESWSVLRCCPWCGRFDVAARPGPGRPREFCPDGCAKKFHDRGSDDRP